MAVIDRRYPGKTAAEIFARVDEVMEDIARRHALHYRKDAAGRTGTVSKMGGTGSYAVRDGQVTVELRFPFLIPGPVRRQIESDVERKLDVLF
jgi:hypothetical protein